MDREVKGEEAAAECGRSLKEAVEVGDEVDRNPEESINFQDCDAQLQRGLQLAVEARTLGSRGLKSGADMGAVFMRDDGQVISWGCARSLLLTRPVENLPHTGEDGTADIDGSTGPAGLRSRVTAIRTDVHAEMDAVAHAAKNGIPLNGCWAFVSGPPCTACFPVLIAAGVKRIIFVGSMERVYKTETCQRMRSIAEQHDVAIIDNMKMPKYVDIGLHNRTLFRDDLDV